MVLTVSAASESSSGFEGDSRLLSVDLDLNEILLRRDDEGRKEKNYKSNEPLD